MSIPSILSISFCNESFKSLTTSSSICDIEAHGKYLAANIQRKIVIQGNTDERGGTEYNLALGQRRAEAVRKTLSLIGVSDSQMEAVSFGKENPKDSGHDEAAWSQNRRADIVYK